MALPVRLPDTTKRPEQRVRAFGLEGWLLDLRPLSRYDDVLSHGMQCFRAPGCPHPKTRQRRRQSWTWRHGGELLVQTGSFDSGCGPFPLRRSLLAVVFSQKNTVANRRKLSHSYLRAATLVPPSQPGMAPVEPLNLVKPIGLTFISPMWTISIWPGSAPST